jgi:WD40 repeat protein
LCISHHPRNSDANSDTRLLVCNNDETIKVYSLPSLQRLTTLGLPTAVNHGTFLNDINTFIPVIASVSPDGRRLAAVGDSNQIFIFDITAGGYYQRIATLAGTNDAGFSCSWNYSSEKLAVSSQDGFVSVWDMRYVHTTNSAAPSGTSFNPSSGAPPRPSASTASSQIHLQRDPTKLACIPSAQHPQVKGACRTVKFSPSPSIDLLAFTEHVNYVNFVDARTFDGKQSYRVSPPGTDMHLSGVCWTPDSRGVFLGLEATVLEFDVDTISRRSFPRGTLI